METFVKLEGVTKIYDTEGVRVSALKDVSFEIGRGEICVIVGQSARARRRF
jgi:putative ABC transport system ATP-binding protein